MFHLTNFKHNPLKYSALDIHIYAVRIIGVCLFILGLALAVWARVHIGRNWGEPMSQKIKPDLITSGPYHFIRHPIYTGILTAGLGTALNINLDWVLVVIVAGVYFIYSATQEEKYMTQQFPEAYPEYKKKTKMLVPYIL
jgi:protein-S-isoprenylcysteine O-methyltransferase Ste14